MELTCLYCDRTPKRLRRGVACDTCYARMRKQGRLNELPVTSPGPDALCKHPECEDSVGRHGAQGYCPKHYQRLTKSRNGLEQPKATAPNEERFRLSASPRGSCACGCACERWTGGISKNGYGHFYWRGKTWLAHRAAWTMAHDEIPEDYFVDHVRDKGCVHTDCVREDHLEAVPPEVNAQRAQHNKEAMARGGREGGANRGLGLRERFLLKISKFPCPCGCACKRWTGAVNKKTGYGNISVNGTTELAHRIAWVLANGRPVPDGLVVDHVKERGCVHRDCVHPGHLEAVTRKVNAQRATCER